MMANGSFMYSVYVYRDVYIAKVKGATSQYFKSVFSLLFFVSCFVLFFIYLFFDVQNYNQFEGNHKIFWYIYFGKIEKHQRGNK